MFPFYRRYCHLFVSFVFLLDACMVSLVKPGRNSFSQKKTWNKIRTSSPLPNPSFSPPLGPRFKQQGALMLEASVVRFSKPGGLVKPRPQLRQPKHSNLVPSPPSYRFGFFVSYDRHMLFSTPCIYWRWHHFPCTHVQKKLYLIEVGIYVVKCVDF